MITIQMTEAEYKAYQLYLKSVKAMWNAEKKASRESSMDEYLSDPANRKEIEAGLEDIKAGRVTYIDPKNIWENIK